MKILKNVNIIDVLNKEILRDKSILLKQGKIEDIFDDEKHNKTNGATVYDLEGKYIIPGIINMHQHYIFKRGFGPINQQLSLPVPALAIRALKNAFTEFKQGITTTRIVNSFHDIDYSLKHLFKHKYIIGPNMFISGRSLVATGSNSSIKGQRIDGVDEFRKWTRERVQYTDWIKTFASTDPINPLIKGGEYSRPQMRTEEIRAICEEAHIAGKKVAAHAIGSESIKNAVEAGVDTIEHGIYLTEELAKKMKTKNIYLVPTISAYKENLNPIYNRGEKWIELHKPLVEEHKKSVKIAADADITMALGLDSLGKLGDEVESMKELVDYDEFEILKFCTYNGAEILGIEDRYGVVEKGKVADLVVLNENPIDDIKNIENVDKVIKDGEVLNINEIKLSTQYESEEYNLMIPELLK